MLNFSSDYLDTSGIKSPTRYNNGGFFLAKPSLVQKFLTIEFAPGKDSIVSLSVSEIDSGTEFYSGFIPVFISKDDTFKIASLLFSDTDIFASDSSFQGHNSQMIARSISDMNAGWSNQDHTEANFTAYSFNLSGIFRPTHFADQSIVTEVPAKQEALSVTSLNGSLRCSFGASPQERLLEIYSPLGIRTASCSVSPSQTEAIIPRIGTGFYFVRLGGSLAKVFVAE
ncbi:MAG TPA: hypothetical protein VFH95_01270 [Candidatus Kapabacteria bacterium]|nr:hypothetical protein [Candidatus Kapabacteria bacterium]